jgi:hypothetical protein
MRDQVILSAASPARPSFAWKPRLENGAPRSLMKTKGILVSLNKMRESEAPLERMRESEAPLERPHTTAVRVEQHELERRLVEILKRRYDRKSADEFRDQAVF